ncbi:hypothetical protein EDB83DRAFT_1483170 [Lactarius deliciosus]|nr:hypothetical protein EDB83DRAFT_1483170 [Lactarius deliciosus]
MRMFRLLQVAQFSWHVLLAKSFRILTITSRSTAHSPRPDDRIYARNLSITAVISCGAYSRTIRELECCPDDDVAASEYPDQRRVFACEIYVSILATSGINDLGLGHYIGGDSRSSDRAAPCAFPPTHQHQQTRPNNCFWAGYRRALAGLHPLLRPPLLRSP